MTVPCPIRNFRLYIHEYFACRCVCIMAVKHHVGAGDKPGPQKHQQGLLTTEPSVHPLILYKRGDYF